MKEVYAADATDPSLEELKELAKWFNARFGNHPIIVGGWAAYFYNKGLGSKDIDVVFLDSESLRQTLSAYFLSHGYEEKRRELFGFDKEMVKTVKSGERSVEILIDAVSSKRIIVFSGSKARLPWSWAVKHNVEKKVNGATVFIPTPELLLVYKFGAVFGRNINLRTGIDFEYYRSKIWKDVYDIMGLSRLEVDEKTVVGFLKESGLYAHRNEIMRVIDDNYTEETKSLVRDANASKIGRMLTGSGDDSVTTNVTTNTTGVYNPRH